MKSSRSLLTGLALASLLNPASMFAPAFAQAAKPMPSAAAAHSVVMPLSEGSNMCLSVHPSLPMTGKMTFWAPKPAELRRLEADMPKYLANYYRQYIGASQGGKRLILINGFSSDVASEFIGGKYDWHKSTVSVMDGGHGFFQATYDLDTHTFVGPHFNGMG